MRPTLRIKLTLWYGLLFGTVSTALGIILYTALRHGLYQEMDLSLEAIADVIATNLREDAADVRPGNLELILEEFPELDLAGKFFQVYDPQGAVLIASESPYSPRLALTPSTLRSAQQDRSTIETLTPSEQAGATRLFTHAVAREKKVLYIVQVGAPLQRISGDLRQLFTLLVIVLPAAVSFALAVGWFMARKSLRPVEEMTRTARRIAGGDLSGRLRVEPAQDEIGHLAATFNEMLARLDEAFQKLRAFTANASHELRTPLTILKGETELALKKPRSPAEYQEVLASLLEEIDRMSRIVDDLLFLSKGDARDTTPEPAAVRLDAVVQEAGRRAALLAQSKGVKFELPKDHAINVIGDGKALYRLFLNLFENAIHYTPGSGRVVVSLEDEGDFARVSVIDNGIGISPDELEHIFDRFYRAPRARACHEKGTGLGLSICEWIAKTHSGRIEVKSRVNEGSEFSVYLPAERSPVIATGRSPSRRPD